MHEDFKPSRRVLMMVAPGTSIREKALAVTRALNEKFGECDWSMSYRSLGTSGEYVCALEAKGIRREAAGKFHAPLGEHYASIFETLLVDAAALFGIEVAEEDQPVTAVTEDPSDAIHPDASQAGAGGPYTIGSHPEHSGHLRIYVHGTDMLKLTFHRLEDAQQAIHDLEAGLSADDIENLEWILHSSVDEGKRKIAGTSRLGLETALAREQASAKPRRSMVQALERALAGSGPEAQEAEPEAASPDGAGITVTESEGVKEVDSDVPRAQESPTPEPGGDREPCEIVDIFQEAADVSRPATPAGSVAGAVPAPRVTMATVEPAPREAAADGGVMVSGALEPCERCGFLVQVEQARKCREAGRPVRHPGCDV